MMMTMEEEYRRESELFPSPERLEKVSYLLPSNNGQSHLEDKFTEWTSVRFGAQIYKN